MEFRTKVIPIEHRGVISHSTPLMMLGSCFSDEVGGRLRDSLVDVCINPYGTLYNPASIESSIERIIACRPFSRHDLVARDGKYHSFAAHSSLSAVDPGQVIENLNGATQDAHNFLMRAKVVMITLGTSYVFRLRESRAVVANCHKFPAKYFERTAMTVSEIEASLTRMVTMLRSVNPGMTVVLTVSPIRHKSDGLHGNQLSKARLLLAIDAVEHAHEGVIYFPAYEALIDDLRDYRFYAADMMHPSTVAVDYVYEMLSDAFFSDDTRTLAAKCSQLVRRLHHRLPDELTDATRAFRADTIRLRDSLLAEHPELEGTLFRLMI